MKTITLHLKPSAILTLIFCAVAVLFIACVWLSGIVIAYKAFSTLAILASALYAIANHALLMMPKSIVQVHINEDGECLLKNKLGNVFEMAIAGDSVVHPFCTTLYYKTNFLFGQVVLITSDRVNPNDFRALRVWLLWGKQDKKSLH